MLTSDSIDSSDEDGNMKYGLFCALALTGCFASIQRSRAVLGPDRTQAEVRLTSRDTGRALVRMFACRGYTLVDQRPTATGIALHFKGYRESVVTDRQRGWSTQFGSSFHVSIDRAPPDRSVVSIDGSPIVDDIEACPANSDAPCRPLLVEIELASHVDGRAEAEVVHGIFSELAVEDLVVGPTEHSQVFAQVQEQARERCRAERHRALMEAYDTDDAQLRKDRIRLAPTCP